jgi:HemX protein
MMTPWVQATLILYLVSLAAYARNLYVENKWVGRFAAACLAAGLGTHYLALMDRARELQSVPYEDLWGSLSLFAWLLGATYLCLELVHRGRSVGPFVLPFVLVLYCLADLRTVAPHPVPARGALFAMHVTMVILAYSAFALAFVLSAIYLLQHRLLRRHAASRMFWRFPSLDVLERMTRSGVLVGILALAIGLTCGFVWADRLQGHYWNGDPKEIVSVAILAFYAAYLFISRQAAWRGARASAICMLNFVLVIFSYSVVNVYLSRYHKFY